MYTCIHIYIYIYIYDIRDIVSQNEQFLEETERNHKNQNKWFWPHSAVPICQIIVQRSCSSLDVGAGCLHDLSMCYFRSRHQLVSCLLVWCGYLHQRCGQDREGCVVSPGPHQTTF